MRIKASRHVFGAARGYKTLAFDAEITTTELKELEVLSFGQTADSSYLGSLSNTPAYWCRRLTSGRRAITRILEGAIDEKGRATLLLVSILFDIDLWESAIGANEYALMDYGPYWQWDGKSRMDPIVIDFEAPAMPMPTEGQRAAILSLLGALESLRNLDDVSLLIAVDSVDRATFEMLPHFLPPHFRREFRYAARSLSDGLPVMVNWLSRAASRGKSRRKSTVWQPEMGFAEWQYTSALAHFWQSPSAPPWEFIQRTPVFGKHIAFETSRQKSIETEVQHIAGGRSHRAPQVHARSIGVKPLIIGALVLAALSAGILLGDRFGKAEDTIEATAVMDFFQTHQSPELLTLELCNSGVLSRGQELLESVRAGDIDSSAIKIDVSKLSEWVEAAQDRCKSVRRVRRQLAAFDELTATLHIGITRLEQIPGVKQLGQIQSWKQEFEDDLAELGATSLSQAMDDRLVQINKWLQLRKSLLERLQNQLDISKDYIEHMPSDRLSNAVEDKWKSEVERLAKLNATLEDTDHTDDDAFRKGFRSSLRQCKTDFKVARKKRRDLRLSFDESWERAKKNVDDMDAAKHQPELFEAREAARLGLDAIDQALAVWPDHIACQNKGKAVVDSLADLDRKILGDIERLIKQAESNSCELDDCTKKALELNGRARKMIKDAEDVGVAIAASLYETVDAQEARLTNKLRAKEDDCARRRKRFDSAYDMAKPQERPLFKCDLMDQFSLVIEAIRQGQALKERKCPSDDQNAPGIGKLSDWVDSAVDREFECWCEEKDKDMVEELLARLNQHLAQIKRSGVHRLNDKAIQMRNKIQSSCRPTEKTP